MSESWQNSQTKQIISANNLGVPTTNQTPLQGQQHTGYGFAQFHPQSINSENPYLQQYGQAQPTFQIQNQPITCGGNQFTQQSINSYSGQQFNTAVKDQDCEIDRGNFQIKKIASSEFAPPQNHTQLLTPQEKEELERRTESMTKIQLDKQSQELDWAKKMIDQLQLQNRNLEQMVASLQSQISASQISQKSHQSDF